MREAQIYIHIPFCVRKCGYCDFVSVPAGREVQASYQRALLREIRAQEERLSIPSVFFGGGTPSIVDPLYIEQILSCLRSGHELWEGAEITLEANPGTLTPEKLDIYRRAGVNRLSLGLQSASDEELRMLGRIHTYGEFLESFRAAREAGFSNINVDLMAALPGQTEESFEETLRTVSALSPEHLSVYSLIIEEGTPFHEKYHLQAMAREEGREDTWPLPTEETERQMYHRARQILEENGYFRYEISNYARKGCQCRHNVGYWTGVPYLGFGVSASSYFGGRRFSDTRDLGEYLEVLAGQDENASEASGQDLSRLRTEEELVTRERAMEEFMFLGLRLTAGVQEAEFLRRFGSSVEEVYGQAVSRMEEQGLMEREGGRLRLTERGNDVSNYVLSEFLLDP